jgi:hypothetical protein
MAKRQSRRSISVRGETYRRVREYCLSTRPQLSMSDFIEARIVEFFGGKRTAAPDRSARHLKRAAVMRQVAERLSRAGGLAADVEIVIACADHEEYLARQATSQAAPKRKDRPVAVSRATAAKVLAERRQLERGLRQKGPAPSKRQRQPPPPIPDSQSRPGISGRPGPTPAAAVKRAIPVPEPWEFNQ